MTQTDERDPDVETTPKHYLTKLDAVPIQGRPIPRGASVAREDDVRAPASDETDSERNQSPYRERTDQSDVERNPNPAKEGTDGKDEGPTAPDETADDRPQGPAATTLAIDAARPLTIPMLVITFLVGVTLTLTSVLVVRVLTTNRANDGSDARTGATDLRGVAQPAAAEDAMTPAQVARKCLPSVVSIQATTPKEISTGSGIVIDDRGHMLTNWHVIDGAARIAVTADGHRAEAHLLGGDESSDVAVLKADPHDLGDPAPMEVGDPSTLAVGDWVMALGNPLGLDRSASAGIVSGLARDTVMPASEGNTVYPGLIQVDAAINGGNSGGALVDANGRLVGMNALYANESGSDAFAGIGFAIPADFAMGIAARVLEGETKIAHAYLGISCLDATSDEDGSSNGAYVAETIPESPGTLAGIAVGDVIVRVGDRDVSSADDYVLAVREHAPGDTVEVTVTRFGEPMTLKVTLGSDENR